MGTHGGEDYQKRERDLIHRINLLSPPSMDGMEQEAAASWAFLRAKKRG